MVFETDRLHVADNMAIVFVPDPGRDTGRERRYLLHLAGSIAELLAVGGDAWSYDEGTLWFFNSAHLRPEVFRATFDWAFSTAVDSCRIVDETMGELSPFA